MPWAFLKKCNKKKRGSRGVCRKSVNIYEVEVQQAMPVPLKGILKVRSLEDSLRSCDAENRDSIRRGSIRALKNMLSMRIRHVKFGKIDIREYKTILGDNPGGTS